jgi:hypothetical protein
MPPFRVCSHKSEHLYAVYLNGISSHWSRNGHVMSFMALECIRIGDIHYLLVAIRDDYRRRTLS